MKQPNRQAPTSSLVERLGKKFQKGFQKATRHCRPGQPRVGLELKFPVVDAYAGGAPSPKAIQQLWTHLADSGWKLTVDPVSAQPVGAEISGEFNNTLASCETGYCKVELSLAHAPDLHAVRRQLQIILTAMGEFGDQEGIRFLGYGIQPVTRPHKKLLMNKARANVWGRMLPSNQCLAPHEGDDVHLFTINSGNHVHLSLPESQAIQAVNVINGFAPAQITLTANSPVWSGQLDPNHHCVAEKFWDWWRPAQGRVGMPSRPFRDLHDYVKRVVQLRPLYVRREGHPILIHHYDSFAEFFDQPTAEGIDLAGQPVVVVPDDADLKQHNSFYWYNCRISRYYTVENRTNDQQPPSAMMAISALTLGLASALQEAEDVLITYDWEELRQWRSLACLSQRSPQVNRSLWRLASQMVEVAEVGLRRRGLGEEEFLAPLWQRVQTQTSPAMRMQQCFLRGGIKGLLEAASL